MISFFENHQNDVGPIELNNADGRNCNFEALCSTRNSIQIGPVILKLLL